MSANLLELPPFPPLRWNSFFWVGEVSLPSLVGPSAAARRQAVRLGIADAGDPAPGSVKLTISPANDEAQGQPTAAQLSAYEELLAHEAEVAQVVLQALFEYYPAERAAYHDAYDEEDFDSGELPRLPELRTPGELFPYIDLHTVHLLAVERDGVAYFGFQFHCAWDEEHGAGVMVHRQRIIQVGQASEAFATAVAQRDANPLF